MYTRYQIELGKMLDTKRLTGAHELRYLRNTDVQWDTINTDELPVMDIEPSERERYTVRRGDLLVCEGGDVGRTAVWQGDDGTVGYQKALHRLRALSADEHPRFMCYTMRFASSSGALIAEGNPNTIPHLTGERFRLCRFPTPPLNEQQAIAVFLDRETAKIDALVAEQERLMALLREKRQAVILHAVTKGLNPDASMVASGVEWLGHVPAHWRVDRIANLFREVMEEGLDGLPILSVSIHTGVSDDELDEADLERKVTRSDDRTKYKRVAPDDLVYNMMRAWQGGFGTVGVAGMVSPAYVVARPRVHLRTDYIEHVLRTPNAVEQMRRHSRGVTDFRLRLYWEEFRNIRVPVPPRDEMDAICARIAKLSAQFTAMTDACIEAIDILIQRRAALITAAVTGQIDVRHLIPADAA
jgi:type I restriction enzyme S subunit